jgi:hypothetical protein
LLSYDHHDECYPADEHEADLDHERETGHDEGYEEALDVAIDALKALQKDAKD